MSALSSTNVRGVSQKSYGLDPATGQLVADHHPIASLLLNLLVSLVPSCHWTQAPLRRCTRR